MGKSPGSCTTKCLTVFVPVMTSTKFGQLRSVRQSTKTDWNHWLTPLSKTILLNTWHSCWRVAVCDDHGFAPWWGHCSLLLSLISINQSIIIIYHFINPAFYTNDGCAPCHIVIIIMIIVNTYSMLLCYKKYLPTDAPV